MNKKFFFALLVLFTSAPLWAVPVYLTFTGKGEGAVDKSQVRLKLEEFEFPVTDVLFVDTANRSPQTLAHPGGRRLYVFVYDFIFSTPESLLQARKTTQAFLAKIPADDLISVAGITAQDGLKLFCAPTADRNKVIAGLNWMGQKRVAGMQEGPEGNLYPEDFSADQPPALIADDAFLQNIKAYAVAEKDKKEIRPVLLQSVADLGFLLSALDGRKHVILFTPGTDASGLSINLPLRNKAPKKRGADSNVAEPEHADLDSITDTSISQERMEKKASSGGIRQKPQKQSGENLPDLIAGTDAHVHIFNSGTQEQGLFKNLASRTEGTFIPTGTDGASAVDQIVSSDKTYYVVSADAATDKMKDLNTVHLNVQNQEVKASTRWLIPKIPSNYTPIEKKAKIAENIYKNYVHPPASYHFWADFMLDQNHSRIPAFVQIDGPPLLANKAEMLDLEFYAFATDKKGDVLDYSYFVFSLDLKNKTLQDKLKTSGIKIWNVLLGNVQPATIHWTIINLATNEMLDQSVPIEGIDQSMTLSQPFFPSMNLNWIVWPQPNTSLTKRGMEITYPYKEGKDLLFFPDISPVIKKAAEGQVFYLRAYNLATPGKIPPVRVSLVDSSGKANEVKTLGLLQNPTPLEPKGMSMFWRLATLPDLAPGDYQLKVSTMDPQKNQEIVRELLTHVQ